MERDNRINTELLYPILVLLNEKSSKNKKNNLKQKMDIALGGLLMLKGRANLNTRRSRRLGLDPKEMILNKLYEHIYFKYS